MPTIPTPEQGLRLRLDAEVERLRTQAGDSYNRHALTYLHPNLDVRQVRFGVWNAPKITLTNVAYYVVKETDLGRLDNIAFDFYGDPRFWWAIAHVNQIRNVLVDMEIGMTLIIPQKEAIIQAIETGNRALFQA